MFTTSTAFSFLSWSCTVQSNVRHSVNLRLVDVIILLSQSIFSNLLKGMLHVDSLFSTCLKIRDVVFRITPVLCASLRNLYVYVSGCVCTGWMCVYGGGDVHEWRCVYGGGCVCVHEWRCVCTRVEMCVECAMTMYLSVLQVNLVAEDNKGEVLWVSGRSLNKELVSP